MHRIGGAEIEKHAPVRGDLVPAGLGDKGFNDLAKKGLEDAKQIIERRVILPLEEPELASRQNGERNAGVVPGRMGNRHPSIAPYETFAAVAAKRCSTSSIGRARAQA